VIVKVIVRTRAATTDEMRKKRVIDLLPNLHTVPVELGNIDKRYLAYLANHAPAWVCGMFEGEICRIPESAPGSRPS
jgi:hypothetical protein